MINYQEYHFTAKEWLKYGIIFFLAVFCISYLFYDNLYLFILAVPLMIPYFKVAEKREKESRLRELNLQFKDALTALTASLHTGYAIENAFREAHAELITLHGKNALIVQEFSYMLKQMRVSKTVEQVVSEFAGRSGVEDIENFSEIFAMANRSSGGLIAVMDATTETIGQKIEVEREIFTMIQGKKMEQRIMSLVPLGMIGYLRLGNGTFMEVLYSSMTGRLIMTASLFVYFVSLLLAQKIMEIKI